MQKPRSLVRQSRTPKESRDQEDSCQGSETGRRVMTRARVGEAQEQRSNEIGQIDRSHLRAT